MLGQGRALSVVRVPIKMYPKKARTPIVWNGGPNGHARLPHRVVKMAATCPRTTRKPPLLKTPTGVLSTTRGLIGPTVVVKTLTPLITRKPTTGSLVITDYCSFEHRAFCQQHPPYPRTWRRYNITGEHTHIDVYVYIEVVPCLLLDFDTLVVRGDASEREKQPTPYACVRG
ncbi:hypothetical protein KQX54_005698 [Cotesia glomerata]|uniref:Uncharacterized protein n=1 Tax=Cotesia glomerata TaxID=32391 RepID=A0AAV7J7L9_COTGL|nr:hypothetical protein KQX54_005698 [Cotesia glomerata]